MPKPHGNQFSSIPQDDIIRQDKITRIKEYFSKIETTKEHNGYFCSVEEVLTVVILGTLCGLKNVSQISQWSEEESVRGLLAKHLGIERIPCYSWLLCLLKLIDMKSLNQCLMRWAQSLIPDGKQSMTISFDGKTIRSTGKMSAPERNGFTCHRKENGFSF